ncbi:MAG: M28 family peptidase, partial [Flavobacteriales bacterium]|nr:M28 family peptidase [Flavobacteriales bacterium]
AINGVGTSPAWKPAFEKLSNGRFKFVFSESGVGPSDHTSFYLKDIPVLHFFTGQHDDYHKPTDDVEKVNFEGMAKVGSLIYDLISELNDKDKLAFTKTKDSGSSKAPAFSVTLGVIPDYLFDGKGMRISGVKEDRPAANAKIMAGDIVIKMGDIEIVDMMSYMKGLAAFEKGDKATVIVIRGEKELKKKVKF